MIPTAISGQDVTQTSWLIPYILGGFGPSVAGIIMIYRNQKKEKRRDFWKRVIDFKRISVGWYLFIILLYPTLFGLSILIDRLIGNPIPKFEVLGQIAANPILVVGMLVTGIITGPLSEELGWRGYALDQLQARWSPLVSSLILAPVWWAWHLPLFFMRGTTQYKWGLNSASFWLFTISIVPLSILMTWVYNNNKKSILAAILLHFMANTVFGLVYPFSLMVYLFQVALLSITAGAIVLLSNQQLSDHEYRNPVLERYERKT
jgi:membrane protease YdiL (CAAX protease family)